METINKYEIKVNNEVITITENVVNKIKEVYPNFNVNFKEKSTEEVINMTDEEFDVYEVEIKDYNLAIVLLKKMLKLAQKSTHLNKEQTLLLHIYNAGKNGIGVEKLFELGKSFRDSRDKLSPISDGMINARWNVKNKDYDQRGAVEINKPDNGEPVNCKIYSKTFPARPDSKFALKRKCTFENKITLQRGHENLKQYLLNNGAKEEMFTYDWIKLQAIKTK